MRTARPRAGRAVSLLALVLLAACRTRSDDSAPTLRTSTPIADSASVARDSGRAHPVRLPPLAGRFDYQIGGGYPPQPSVTVLDRDRAEPAVPGRYNICYLNAFQTQADAKEFWIGKHPDLLLTDGGGYRQDADWPGEIVLDTSTAAHRAELAAVLDGWIDGCAAEGYQAIEPDNLDSWTRSGGVLTSADNLALASMLVAHAHARGLAVAQKNGSELGAAGRGQAHFDFAITEDCQVYSECAAYTDVYAREVIEIEYTDQPAAAYRAACAARSGQVSVIRRDRAVTPAGRPGYHYEWC